MEDLLNKSTQTLLCEFWDFSEKTEELLKQLDVSVKLPIDIQNFAKKLGLSIEDANLIPFSERHYGYINQNTITIKANLIYKEKRWVIAKSIASFLIHENKVKEGLLIANPFLVSYKPAEFYLDSLAMLILFPISLFKKEVSENIDETNDLLQYLSDKSQISQFQMSIGYQLLKQMLWFQRNQSFKECNYDITQVSVDQYENIFV